MCLDVRAYGTRDSTSRRGKGAPVEVAPVAVPTQRRHTILAALAPLAIAVAVVTAPLLLLALLTLLTLGPLFLPPPQDFPTPVPRPPRAVGLLRVLPSPIYIERRCGGGWM